MSSQLMTEVATHTTDTRNKHAFPAIKRLQTTAIGCTATRISCYFIYKEISYFYIRYIATCYGLDGSGIESYWGWNFFCLSSQPSVQWEPGVFPGKSGGGTALITHPHLAQNLKNRAVPLLPLFVFMACSMVEYRIILCLLKCVVSGVVSVTCVMKCTLKIYNAVWFLCFDQNGKWLLWGKSLSR